MIVAAAAGGPGPNSEDVFANTASAAHIRGPRTTGRMGGVIGAGRPATGAVATWARRRSGFMPLACGVMAPVFGTAASAGPKREGDSEAAAATAATMVAASVGISVGGSSLEGLGDRLEHWRPVY